MSTTAENPDCATCGTTLQEVLYGMPSAEDAHSGKYLIMGCTIDDDSPRPRVSNSQSFYLRVLGLSLGLTSGR